MNMKPKLRKFVDLGTSVVGGISMAYLVYVGNILRHIPLTIIAGASIASGIIFGILCYIVMKHH